MFNEVSGAGNRGLVIKLTICCDTFIFLIHPKMNGSFRQRYTTGSHYCSIKPEETPHYGVKVSALGGTQACAVSADW